MQILITKGQTADSIEVRRRDGSTAATNFPHKGPVPHDAAHFFVESELAIDDGFWGMVERGRHPEEIAAVAKAAGHASAARPQAPDESIVPIVQAERLVECFEADLWGGGSDPQTFRAMADAGCEQSLVPIVPLSDEEIEGIRRHIADFRDRWAATPVGGQSVLEWRAARAAT